MRKSLTFNGIRKSWLYLLEGRQKSPFPPVRNNLIRVPGMPGAHVGSKETDVLYITQPIGFIVKDDEHALQLKDELASWLLTNEAVPLEFDDEPGRTYYAEIEGTIEDFERFVDQRRGVITFLCSDPFSYGPEKEYEFESDSAIIENVGTAEADPVFEIEVLEPVTFAMVSNGSEYNMIGRPFDVDEIPTEKYPRALQENGSSLTGWSHRTAGTVISDGPFSGIAGGTMQTNGYAFYADPFGSNPNGWTGPMIRRSFSNPLQDFKATVDLQMMNRYGGVGKVVITFLDASDNIVASMGAYDATNGYANNKIAFRLGGTREIHHTQGAGGNDYNHTRLWIELTREGQVFNGKVYRKNDNGELHYRNFMPTFHDRQNQYQQEIHQVQIYIAKAKEFPVFDMYMHGLSVFGINDLDDMQVPYIADVGDIIKLDHKEDEMYINGEPRKDLKEGFGGTYFKLHKGFNSLAVMPEGAFKTKVKYDPRFR